jgi:hypothetical protein
MQNFEHIHKVNKHNYVMAEHPGKNLAFFSILMQFLTWKQVAKL